MILLIGSLMGTAAGWAAEGAIGGRSSQRLPRTGRGAERQVPLIAHRSAEGCLQGMKSGYLETADIDAR